MKPQQYLSIVLFNKNGQLLLNKDPYGRERMDLCAVIAADNSKAEKEAVENCIYEFTHLRVHDMKLIERKTGISKYSILNYAAYTKETKAISPYGPLSFRWVSADQIFNYIGGRSDNE